MSEPSPASKAKAEARKAKRLMLAAAYKAKTMHEALTCYLSIFDHSYSVRNSELLKLQGCPAGRCGGFQQWRNVGRVVRKGQTGYDIMVPLKPKTVAAKPETAAATKTETEEKTPDIYFTWCAVFHENQTEPLTVGETQAAIPQTEPLPF